MAPVTCIVEGCPRPVVYARKRLCQTHYHRQWRGQPLGDAESQHREYTSETCETPDCDKRRKRGSALCSMHVARLERNGGVDVLKGPHVMRGPDNPSWTDTPTYQGLHTRLRKQRGPASAHPCVGCGGAAIDWAYQYTDPHQLTGPEGAYSTDLDTYAPMCRACHFKLDVEKAGKPKGKPFVPGFDPRRRPVTT